MGMEDALAACAQHQSERGVMDSLTRPILLFAGSVCGTPKPLI